MSRNNSLAPCRLCAKKTNHASGTCEDCRRFECVCRKIMVGRVYGQNRCARCAATEKLGGVPKDQWKRGWV